MSVSSTKTLLVLNSFLFLILNVVRSQTYAYDYGYAPNPSRYTRKVHIKQGAMQGVVVEHRNRALPLVEQYLGIPYAAPPTRELRFMPPGSAPSWFGTKIADSFGPVCPQKLPEISSLAPERAEYFGKLVKYLILNQSEDCLYLNIYAPVQEGDFITPKYPVMVFLHGESFEWNSGNPYDGSVLAAYGNVIVVTLNFRLGVFGFLKTGAEETATSNFGLVDQVAALLWVQDNIAAFGGDPNSVTLFGHGTGAVCANLLMLSPMVNREREGALFRRVILMGGTALSDWAIATASRQVTFQVAAALNCPSNEAEFAECLRTRNANDIIDATVATDYYRTRFGPIVDARVIPNNPKHLMSKYSDSFKSFELMYGVTEVESAHLFGPVALTHGILEKERDQELRRYLSVKCEIGTDLCMARTLNKYGAERRDSMLDDQAQSSFAGPGLDTAKLARDTLLDILSDARSVAPMVQMGKLHSNVNVQSYFYVFGHVTASRQHWRNKSIHGDELPYVFGVPIDGPKFHFNDTYTPSERLFSEVIMTYFTNFAATGNPNIPGRAQFYTLSPVDWVQFEKEWPEYDITNESYLYLAIPPEVRMHYRYEQVRYWNEDFQNPRPPPPFYHPTKMPPPWITHRPTKVTRTSRAPMHPTFRPTRLVPPPVIVTSEPESDSTKSSNATNLLIIVGCLFLLTNMFVFAGLYYKCIRLKNKEKKRREAYEAAAIEQIDQKVPENSSILDGCNLMRMISKSSKSEDIYEAVKVSEDGSNTRFKLMRQMSSSTIDPHTKVREWIAQEIVQRCSPRFLRRTKQQLAEEHKAAQQKQQQQQENAKQEKNVTEVGTIGSNSTLGQSPTRPVSPDDKITTTPTGDTKSLVKIVNTVKPSAIPVSKPAVPKKPEKVSVAIDATPAGRRSSVMRQQPIEFTKSLDIHLGPEPETQLRRSFTMDDVVNLPSESDNLGRSSTSINLKFPANKDTNNGLKIQHQHSKSDPVQDFGNFVPTSNSLPKKLRTFELPGDVSVTCKDETEDKLQPLTPEQQLQTIKRRNFPKVLPDLPHATKEALASKRRSMPVSGYLNLPIPEISSFSQPTSPTGKLITRLPPAPPPRTTSTLNRKSKFDKPRVCQTPAALAEEPPVPTEPELTYNNLYIGPLIPVSAKTKSESASDLYRQNIQQIYEPLRPAKSQDQALERREPKTIITADSDHPVKRLEPKVVIKPTISKKTAETSIKVGARVIARNSSEEKFDFGKIAQTKGSKEEINRDGSTEGINKEVKIIGSKVKLQKASQIPTLSKSPSVSPPKKESSSSESTPSEKSDTGTVIKRV